MTTKEIHRLNYWHICLSECNAFYNRAVSAGELAKWVGQTRTTALKHVRELIKNKAATEERVRHNARLKKSVFTAIKAGE